jgi:hypothetical protein
MEDFNCTLLYYKGHLMLKRALGASKKQSIQFLIYGKNYLDEFGT